MAFIYGCVCAICDVYATCEGQGQHLVSFSTNLYSMRPRTELARLTSQQDPGVLLSTLLHPGKSWLQQHIHQILALDRSRQGSWGLLANQPREIGEFQVNERQFQNDTESCFLSCIFTWAYVEVCEYTMCPVWGLVPSLCNLAVVFLL